MSEIPTPKPDLVAGPSQTGYLRARLNGMAIQDLRELGGFVLAGAVAERQGWQDDPGSARGRLLREIHLAIDRKVQQLIDLAHMANKEGAFDDQT